MKSGKGVTFIDRVQLKNHLVKMLQVIIPFMKRRNKRVLNFIQQVFFLLSTEGSLVTIRAY